MDIAASGRCIAGQNLDGERRVVGVEVTGSMTWHIQLRSSQHLRRQSPCPRDKRQWCERHKQALNQRWEGARPGSAGIRHLLDQSARAEEVHNRPRLEGEVLNRMPRRYHCPVIAEVRRPGGYAVRESRCWDHRLPRRRFRRSGRRSKAPPSV